MSKKELYRAFEMGGGSVVIVIECYRFHMISPLPRHPMGLRYLPISWAGLGGHGAAYMAVLWSVCSFLRTLLGLQSFGRRRPSGEASPNPIHHTASGADCADGQHRMEALRLAPALGFGASAVPMEWVGSCFSKRG